MQLSIIMIILDHYIIEKMLKPNTFIKYKHYKNRQGALKKT